MAILAAVGWLLSWVIILGPAMGIMSLGHHLSGGRRILSPLCGLVGFIFGIALMGGLLPEEANGWVDTYSHVFGFFLLTPMGWLALLFGVTGWTMWFVFNRMPEGGGGR